MDPVTRPIAETAGARLEARVPRGREGETAGDALARLARERYALLDPVWVVDAEERLSGVVPTAELLAAAPDAPLASLMRPPPPAVGAETDQERVAIVAHRYRLASVPVVDEGRRFLGVVPPEALIDVLLREHDEDLRRFTGILDSTNHATQALALSPIRRVAYRLPWLFVGLLGAIVAAAVMAGFEARLQAQVAIAFFVPAIVYLADAIGTQSEAVAVRGLSLEQAPLGRLLWGELATGALLGLVLGTGAMPAALLLGAGWGLALAVAVAILAAGTCASAIGLLFPWVLSRLGLDPAYGSGPVATVTQDVLTLLVYFACVAVLV
ncbi:MAG: magnesium transporter [Geminicoccaceae bacterium]|nr:magnesium transporter [Geminicoccaceae bacterium]MCS7268421.1 magnesium transporter [Geminicoccaceae bacterium]MDW8124926.1 magnesium transporter [Geminicoccaceae bacterium]MDW8340974.1 magnesium transporter [Geminicoccaceae bacterium]